MLVSTSTLGFPRMGPNRELKFALEKFWKGDISEEELMRVAESIEDQAWKLQVDAGIDRISVGDHYLYDAVLAWADWLGLIPKRFAAVPRGLTRMFAMARGIQNAPALSKYKCDIFCLPVKAIKTYLTPLITHRYEKVDYK